MEHPDEIKAGVIAVVCEEVRAVGQRDPTAPIKAVQPGNDAEMKKLPEGEPVLQNQALTGLHGIAHPLFISSVLA